MCQTCKCRKLESGSNSHHYSRVEWIFNLFLGLGLLCLYKNIFFWNKKQSSSCNQNYSSNQRIQIQIRRPAPQHHHYHHHHQHQNVYNYIHRPVKYAEPLCLPFQQNIVLKKETHRVLPLTRGELILYRCPSASNLTKIEHSHDCVNRHTCDYSSKWPYFKKESHYCSCYDNCNKNNNNNNYSKTYMVRQPCVAAKENHVSSVHTLHEVSSNSCHESSTVEHVDCITGSVSAVLTFFKKT